MTYRSDAKESEMWRELRRREIEAYLERSVRCVFRKILGQFGREGSLSDSETDDTSEELREGSGTGSLTDESWDVAEFGLH
jgi:hypothetical protein